MNQADYERVKKEVETVQLFRRVFMTNAKVHRAGKRVIDNLSQFAYMDATEHKDPQGNRFAEADLVRITGRKETYNWIMKYLNYPKEEMRQNKKSIREYEMQRRGELL